VENPIKAIRGMNDILPSEIHLWQNVENTFRQVLQNFGYQEIRVPILEKTELFKRTIGEATDIVEKEMYTFLDRNQESLTLRPEGTAGCVRAGIEHGLFYNQTQRLWYLGPNFRYERPQKGRYRQFHHCGVETFGMEGPDIDAELILLCATIFERLGLLSRLNLQINSLGTSEARERYREELIHYFTCHQDQLDEDSQRRLSSNPMRILDSKNPALQTIIANAPKMINYLDQESEQHFIEFQDYLNQMGISFTVNPCLVRGLDYYTKTVFEWVTNELGAQNAVCAGGRFDGLVEHLGGRATPALGFAIGLERVILLLQQIQTIAPDFPHVYFITDNKAASKIAFKLTKQLRETLPELRIIVHCGGGSLKSQFKKADKSGAQLALILGDQELDNQVVAIKFLRKDIPQEEIPQQGLASYLQGKLKSPRP
jgi:histidyl-tRNA synthetase